MIPAAAKKKKPLCNHYFGGIGVCPDGDSCAFSHAACFPRREEEASPSLVGDKLLSCFDGDQSAWRGYKETLLGFMKERVSVEDLLKETRTLNVRHLLPEVIGSFYKRYPKRYNLLIEALNEEKRKVEALKDEKAKVQALKDEKAKVEALKEDKAKLEAETDFKDRQVQAAAVSLEIEKERLIKCAEFEARNVCFKSEFLDFSSLEVHMAKLISQIRWRKDSVSAKMNEIFEIFGDPNCPESICIAAFAKQIVSAKQNPFACSYIIVKLTSQYPQAMDIVLAEFHKACMYTVPKHIVGSELDFDSDACKRTMSLYGALVQSDFQGNLHGIDQGYEWLKQFVENIPTTNCATKAALKAFLETAGFQLYQAFKSEFVKLLATKDISLGSYLKEPIGRAMKKRNVLSFSDDDM